MRRTRDRSAAAGRGRSRGTRGRAPCRRPWGVHEPDPVDDPRPGNRVPETVIEKRAIHRSDRSGHPGARPRTGSRPGVWIGEPDGCLAVGVTRQIAACRQARTGSRPCRRRGRSTWRPSSRPGCVVSGDSSGVAGSAQSRRRTGRSCPRRRGGGRARVAVEGQAEQAHRGVGHRVDGGGLQQIAVQVVVKHPLAVGVLVPAVPGSAKKSPALVET